MMKGRPVLCYVCQGAGGTLVKDDNGYRLQNSRVCGQINSARLKQEARKRSPLVVAKRSPLILPGQKEFQL